MKSKNSHISFLNLGQKEWQNLGLAAICQFGLIFWYFQLFHEEIFIGYGYDFLAFISAGKIINNFGFEKVYDLLTLAEVQQKIHHILFVTAPAAFLPIFLVPFQVLALFEPKFGFLFWTGINLITYVVYFYYIFLRSVNSQHRRRLILIIATSYSFLITLQAGQVNVFLVICVGEFIRYYFKNKPFQSGLWLGGLLLKPQILVLIVPFLILQKAWRTIGGFSLSLIGLSATSLLLGGWSTIKSLLSLWLNFAVGIPTNNPGNMMNWRMLGVRLSNLDKPFWGWIVVVLGMIATFIVTIYLWKRSSQILNNFKFECSEKTWLWCVLGTLAATCALTWHSHLHMGLILIPLIAYLYSIGDLKDRWLNLWLFLPYGTLLFSFIIGTVLKNPYIMSAGNLGGFLVGLCGLFINLLFLFIAFHRVKNIKKYLNNKFKSPTKLVL